MSRPFTVRWAERLRRRMGPADRPSDSIEDARLVAGLRARDEAVFAEVVDRYGATMVRVALLHLPTLALAEDAVQETWLAVFKSIDRFEGRSSLRTWVFSVLVNKARSLAAKEGRSVPLTAVETGDTGASVDPERFRTSDRHWASPPHGWSYDPENQVLNSELHGVLRTAIGTLASPQRAVVLLRDVHGFSGSEVCRLLELSPGNQRVLLHRGRSRVRGLVESYVGARHAARA